LEPVSGVTSPILIMPVTKSAKKAVWLTSVGPDLCVGGSTVEELLVGVQKPFLANEVIVVVVLKDCRGLKVQRCQVVVT
jgi:hypothetical protein